MIFLSTLDLNSNKITNLLNGTLPSDAVNLSQLTPYANQIGNFGQQDIHGTFNDFNTVSKLGNSFIVGPGTNAPSWIGSLDNHSYQTLYSIGSNYDAVGTTSNSYSMQTAIGRNSITPYYSVRWKEGGIYGSWNKIWAGKADSLVTPRIINGTLFDGTTDIKNTEYFQSDRNFTLGTLIKTSIPYPEFGDAWLLEIKGNSYGLLIPFDIKIQGYIYNTNGVPHYALKGLSNGTSLTGVVVISVNGNLCFWYPTQGYWHGFNVTCYRTTNSIRGINEVVSITNEVKPTTATKEVSIPITQSLHSDNFNNYTPTLTGNGASGTWNINILGNAQTLQTYTPTQLSLYLGDGILSGNRIVTQNANNLTFQQTTGSVIINSSGPSSYLRFVNSGFNSAIRTSSGFFIIDHAGISNAISISSLGKIGFGLSPNPSFDISGGSTFLSALLVSGYTEFQSDVFVPIGTAQGHAIRKSQLDAALSGIGSVYQPLENQRLSTSNVVSFNNISSTNNIIGAGVVRGSNGVDNYFNSTTGYAILNSGNSANAGYLGIYRPNQERSMYLGFTSNTGDNNLYAENGAGFDILTQSASNIRFSTNWIERFRVAGTGGILIGTTVDTGEKLSILGDVRLSVNSNFKIENATQLKSVATNFIGHNTVSFNMNGMKLTPDEDFGSTSPLTRNSVIVYNNNGGSALSMNLMNTVIPGNPVPNSSSNYLKIVVTNVSPGTSPGWGGFNAYNTPLLLNRTYLLKFKAWIPNGYTVNLTSNDLGNNAQDYWINNPNGTGKWEEYTRIIKTGDSGTISSSTNVYLSGGITPTVAAPLIWYICSCTVIELTNNDVVNSRVLRSNVLQSGNGTLGGYGQYLTSNGPYDWSWSTPTWITKSTATINYLPKFTSTGGNVITNSSIIDTGSFTGIGQPTPDSRLDVIGIGSRLRVGFGITGDNYLDGTSLTLRTSIGIQYAKFLSTNIIFNQSLSMSNTKISDLLTGTVPTDAVNLGQLNSYDYFTSDRNFPLGTQITTSIPYGAFGDAWLLHIKGNSYGNIVPIDVTVQGYIYSSIANYGDGGMANGTSISGLVAFEQGGNLCFWFPNQGYWQGYSVSCKIVTTGGYKPNTVTAITNTAKPTTGITKEVAINNITQGINTQNKNVFGQNLESVNNLGNVTSKPIQFVQYGSMGGIIGVYDPTTYSQVYSMCTDFSLSLDGKTGGNFYGIARGYEPDYLAVGNNPQSKYGLGHQYLFMENGATTTSLGSGIWTSGLVTSNGFTTTGNYTTTGGNFVTDQTIGTGGYIFKTGGVSRLFNRYDGLDSDLSQSGLSWYSYNNDGSINKTIANLYRNGDLSVSNEIRSPKIVSLYNSSKVYNATLSYNNLQLGNNSVNYIVGGKSTVGGSLMFYVNNVNDVSTTTSTIPDGKLIMNMKSDGVLAVGFGTTDGLTNKLRLYDSGGALESSSSNDFGFGISHSTGRFAISAGQNGFIDFFTQNIKRLGITYNGNVDVVNSLIVGSSILSNQQIRAGNSSTKGFIVLNDANSTLYSGYIEFYAPDQLRVGYIGFATNGGNIQYTAQNTSKHQFNGDVIFSQSINGNDAFFTGNIKSNNQFQGGFGANSLSGVLDWNDISNKTSGNGFSLLNATAANSATNMSGYYHPFTFEYSSKDGSGNFTQLAIPYNGSDMWLRSFYYGIGYSSWNTYIQSTKIQNVGNNDVIHSGNVGNFTNNATNLTTGILSDLRLSTNVPKINTTNTWTNFNSFEGGVATRFDTLQIRNLSIPLINMSGIYQNSSGILELKGNIGIGTKVFINTLNQLNVSEVTTLTSKVIHDQINTFYSITFTPNSVNILPQGTKMLRMVKGAGFGSTDGVTIQLTTPITDCREQIVIFTGIGLAPSSTGVVFLPPAGMSIYGGGTSKTYYTPNTEDSGLGCNFRINFFYDNTISIIRLRDN